MSSTTDWRPIGVSSNGDTIIHFVRETDEGWQHRGVAVHRYGTTQIEREEIAGIDEFPPPIF